jgi:plastocyanin
MRKPWIAMTVVALMTTRAEVAVAQAQATASVSGQVTILERPGETTEDLGNVVIYLTPVERGPRERAARDQRSVIALQSRQFSPRVRVIREGSRVEFPNQDPFSHNVFSKMNGGFDTGVFGRGKTREQVFHDAGVYPLYCNVHPRMTAFVVTLSTPHYAQARADGRFVLDSVPPGRYTLHVWHDRATERVRALAVPPGGVANLREELDARGYRYVQHKNKLGLEYRSSGGDRY